MPFVGIGVGIGRQRFAQGGIFAAYAARVAADGGVTEAGSCVNAVSGISLNSSLLLVPSGYKSGVVYSQIPTNGDGDLTFTRASDATRVNSDGEIEVVGSGVPRLDYSQGSCPALLLEPQRTNLLLRSEEFDNASWSNNNRSVSANVANAPNGTQTADLMYPTTTGVFRGTFQAGFPINSYNFSVFAKASGKNFMFFYVVGASATNGVWFDLSNGTIGTIGSSWTNVQIQNFGNGWYRCSANVTLTTTSNNLYYLISDSNNSTTATTNGTDGILIWGAQLEQGAYATSYIKTTTATVTRLADACSKTGISSLIGQTEGTLFVEMRYEVNQTARLTISDGTGNNWIFFSYPETTNNTRVRIAASGIVAIDLTSSAVFSTNQTYKIALGYKSGSWAFYINGSLIYSGTQTFTFNNTLDRLLITGGTNATNPSEIFGKVSQALLFTTRLSNAELAELTTL